MLSPCYNKAKAAILIIYFIIYPTSFWINHGSLHKFTRCGEIIVTWEDCRLNTQWISSRHGLTVVISVCLSWDPSGFCASSILMSTVPRSICYFLGRHFSDSQRFLTKITKATLPYSLRFWTSHRPQQYLQERHYLYKLSLIIISLCYKPDVHMFRGEGERVGKDQKLG